MERSREARKVSMAAPAGLPRRRHRGSGLRDSLDEDGPELQETARLRDRKKESERERDRDRERLSRNKRRRGDRLMHAGNREDGPEDSTDESVNDDDEEEYEEEGGGGAGSLRKLPPNPASASSPSLSNHHHNHSRRSFQQSNPPRKMFRPVSPWKPVDEMIGVPVPRKARSASTKRTHDYWVSGSGGVLGGDQLHRQASTSPARSSLVSATASPSRISPSSSNISIRKKMKPIGANKHRTPPKASSSKAATSNQDEIEFEIAEVLYGLMRQPPGSSKPEGGLNEALNKSAIDSKSRASSPVSAAVTNQPSSLLPQNAASSAMAATAPKRKRPRPVNYSDENVASHSQANLITKLDVEQTENVEITSPNLEKNFKPVLANDRIYPDLELSRADSASNKDADVMKPVTNTSPESESLRPEPIVVGLKDEDASSSKGDSPGNRFGENRIDKSKSTVSGLGIKREEKFQIDLMAPPSALKLSPERDEKIEYVSAEPKKPIADLEELKPMVKDAEKTKLTSNDSINIVEPDQKRFKRGVVEESEVQTASFSKEVFNTEKCDGEIGKAIAGANRQQMRRQQQAQTHLPRAPSGDEATGDKTVLAASSLPSAISMAAWQGGLPSLGYMTPLQGLVSMDGSSAQIQPPQLLLNQPRPKRCATHCYIAQNITYHQQFTRMNPFWPAAAGSAPTLYGAKPCSLNVVPPVELHGSTGGRGVNLVQDKSLGVFNGSSTSKDKPSQGPNIADTAQRKQILVQQSVPAGPPSNLMRGPAFIFPLSQQQAAVAASALTTMKNPLVAGAAPTGNPNSGAGSAPSSMPATMSFNYPNMAANETQYLAILQNNTYQFPFPTHAGAPPVYRGAHPQAMPFFNGPFYSPQMLHPSQLQQQPQQSAHGHQIPPGQNTGLSGGSSSSQKQLQNHPLKSQGNGSTAGTANMKQSFPSPKNRPSQLPLQQQNQHLTEVGSEDSPSTADSRGTRSNLNMNTESLNLPIHAQNFALMSASSVSVSGANGIKNGNHHINSNRSEKKPVQQHQGPKVGVDSLPSHQGFAVSFSSLNGGGPPALDIASMGQSHAILQNFPDAARHSYSVVAAAAPQSHQKKNFRITDEVKKGSRGEASNVEEERKSMVSKGGLTNVGLSIAFSRCDSADSSVPANNVVDSSSRNLKVGSGPGRTSGPLLSNSLSSANSFNFQQQQLQQQQSQQQQKPQLIQLHKQQHQQYMSAAARSKTPSMSNGNVYPDHLSTNVAMAAKPTNSVSAFQQSHAPISGGSSSPTQSPQWKNSARTSISQVQSPALTSSNIGSVKNHYQQQSQLSQQSHMQISFGGSNSKSLTAAQGQQLPTGHQGLSQTMVGSPVASSNYKSGGSPRTTTAGMVTNKAPQVSTLSPSASLQVKNSAMPSRSSSPVGTRNVPSAIGNSNMGISQGNSGSKPQMLQQQQQMKPQLSKQGMQQSQTLFPSYLQTSQGPNCSNNAASLTAANSCYLQRRRPETRTQQQSLSPSGSSSTGMLSMCSSTSAVTSDPAKAIAVAAAGSATVGNNIKAPTSHGTGNSAAAQPSGQAHHLPSSFSYMHVVPAVVQAKPAQQKQVTGE